MNGQHRSQPGNKYTNLLYEPTSTGLVRKVRLPGVVENPPPEHCRT